ncbi:hypothetical protein B0H14DRAFT_2949593, partial [Mycena olivaceomarginata]
MLPIIILGTHVLLSNFCCTPSPMNGFTLFGALLRGKENPRWVGAEHCQQRSMAKGASSAFTSTFATSPPLHLRGPLHPSPRTSSLRGSPAL